MRSCCVPAILTPALLIITLSSSSLSSGVSTSFESHQSRKPSGDANEVARISAQWAKHWNGKELEAVLALYASDAVFLPSTGKRFTGKAAIRDLFQAALDTHDPDVTSRSLKSEALGDMAYDSGQFTETITSEKGKQVQTGNYLTVFKRQPNGRWLITQHMWTDLQQTAPRQEN